VEQIRREGVGFHGPVLLCSSILIFTLIRPKDYIFRTRRNKWGEHPIKFKPAKFRGAPAKSRAVAAGKGLRPVSD
jgi:hypothetical protein